MTDVPESSIYDSRCLTYEQWLTLRYGIYATGTWECKIVPSEKRVYLRRHLSGAVSTETEGWTRE